jgi:hypothetical protein
MLVALADIDRDDAIFQAALLEHDRDLLAVAGGPEIDVYHRASPF